MQDLTPISDTKSREDRRRLALLAARPLTAALCARGEQVTQKREGHAVVVSLDDVVAEMDLPNDAWTAYLNRRTGEFVTVTDEDERLVDAAEEPGDLPGWQRDALPKVREALESDEFLRLPDKFEIHEYRIMERFIAGVEDVGVRDALREAIAGRGAFRRFKGVIHERGVAERWYAFRQRAFKEIAVDWLDAHGVAYTREKRSQSGDGA